MMKKNERGRSGGEAELSKERRGVRLALYLKSERCGG